MILPLRISLKNWAASLIIDFPDDNIPLLKSDKDWHSWGRFLIQENTFVNNGAPDPSDYDDWQAWAIELFKTMANF